MSNCQGCGTEFKFGDVLKGTNPASIKCGGCSERVKSSYVTLILAVILFAIVVVPLWTLKLDLGANGGMIKIGGLLVLALIFEFGYFHFLSKGTIKSNLDIK